MPKTALQDKEFMATLAKGLAVLGSFDKQRPAMTLSQAAQATGLSRATARRILRTLAELGYVAQNGREFSLSSGILKLGFAYLATQNWIEQATPLMRQLSEQFHEFVLGGDPGGNRDRLRRAFSGAAHHVGDACGRHAAAGLPYLAGTDPARLSRRGGALAAADVAARRGLHAIDDHRHAGAVRARAGGPRAGILHRRRGARTRPALDRGAGRAIATARRSRRSM